MFVNAPLDDVLRTLGSVPLTMLQLHGDEGPSYCAEAARRSGLKVIKAVRAKDVHAVRSLSSFKTDFHMIDAYVPGHLRRHRRAVRLGAGGRTSRRHAADPLRRADRGERRRGTGRGAAVRRRRRERRGGLAGRQGHLPSAGLLRGGRAARPPHPRPDGHRRRAALRPLRRPLRARDADARARAARAGVGGGARRPGLPRAARRAAGALRGPAHAALPRGAPVRARRRDPCT